MATSSINANNYGAGASADVYNRVQQTLSSQNTGVAKLNATLTRDQTRLSSLGQLHSALASFQSLAAGLAGNGLSTAATASAKDVLSVTSTGDAKAGTYALEVLQLAQGQFLTSDTFASAGAAIGGGAATTVKVDFGTAGDKTFSPNGSGKSITIAAPNNSLDGIAAALKAAGIDAQVVQRGGGFALTVAGQSGADNSLRISVSGDAAVKNLLAYSPGVSQGLRQTSAAQDALLSVDGKPVRSASNSVAGAIAGATLTLTGKGKSGVTVSQDASQIGKNVGALVSAYNSLNKQLQALQQGGLKGDTALGQVGSQLSQLFRTGGNGVTPTALAAAGVTLAANGDLQLDDKKLRAALTADAAAVGKLFSNGGKGLADQLGAKAAAFTGDNSVIRREAASIGKEITAVNGKRAVLAKALTAQANALAALYTQQAQSSSGSAIAGAPGSASSAFDFLA